MKMHPDNWHGFIPSPGNTGGAEAVRWATRLKYHDPDWGRWHATDGSGSFTACGLAVRLFEVDDSPQRDELTRVNCKRCRHWLAQHHHNMNETD